MTTVKAPQYQARWWCASARVPPLCASQCSGAPVFLFAWSCVMADRKKLLGIYRRVCYAKRITWWIGRRIRARNECALAQGGGEASASASCLAFNTLFRSLLELASSISALILQPGGSTTSRHILHCTLSPFIPAHAYQVFARPSHCGCIFSLEENSRSRISLKKMKPVMVSVCLCYYPVASIDNSSLTSFELKATHVFNHVRKYSQPCCISSLATELGQHLFAQHLNP